MAVGIIDFNDYRELEELDSDFLDLALEKLIQEKERRMIIEKNEAKKHLQKLLNEIATLLIKYNFVVTYNNSVEDCELVPLGGVANFEIE